MTHTDQYPPHEGLASPELAYPAQVANELFFITAGVGEVSESNHRLYDLPRVRHNYTTGYVPSLEIQAGLKIVRAEVNAGPQGPLAVEFLPAESPDQMRVAIFLTDSSGFNPRNEAEDQLADQRVMVLNGEDVPCVERSMILGELAPQIAEELRDRGLTAYLNLHATNLYGYSDGPKAHFAVRPTAQQLAAIIE